MNQVDPIQGAIQQLSRFPGVGRKTASRLVYWLMRAQDETAREIAESLLALAEGVQSCARCCDFTVSELCPVCASPSRDRTTLCVVEHPQDVQAFERSGEFRGQYHVLHGAISPLEGVGPGQLRVRELLARLQEGEVQEVIVATDPDVEGDATALYLARLLGESGVRVTRLAHGISVGTEIEYADAVSLARALHNRTELR